MKDNQCRFQVQVIPFLGASPRGTSLKTRGERRITKDVEMMAGEGDDTARVPESTAPEGTTQRRESSAARKTTG